MTSSLMLNAPVMSRSCSLIMCWKFHWLNLCQYSDECNDGGLCGSQKWWCSDFWLWVESDDRRISNRASRRQLLHSSCGWGHPLSDSGVSPTGWHCLASPCPHTDEHFHSFLGITTRSETHGVAPSTLSMPWRSRLLSYSETCFWRWKGIQRTTCATAVMVSSMWNWTSASFSFPMPWNKLGNWWINSSLACWELWTWLTLTSTRSKSCAVPYLRRESWFPCRTCIVVWLCFALVPMLAVNCPSTASCKSDPYVKMRLFDEYSWVAHVLLTLLKLSSSIMLADAPVSIIICTGMLLTNTETVGVLVFAESPRVYRYLSSLLSVKSGCSWVATCQTCDFGLDCHWRGDVALCPELACFVRHKQNGWVCYICCRFGLWQAGAVSGRPSEPTLATLCWSGRCWLCLLCLHCGFLENLFGWTLFAVAFTVPENCSIPLSCVSLTSMDLAYASRASSDRSSQRAIRLSHFDVQFWMTVDFSSRFVSANSQLTANFRSLVGYWSTVSPDIWVVVRNLKIS